jgi:small membrane protein
MISYLLTILIAPFFLYAFRAWRVSRLIALALLGVAAVALAFAWDPGLSTRLAALLGVGRGADLVLYVYSLISFILILDLSLKMKAQHELITRLARELALRSISSAAGESK